MYMCVCVGECVFMMELTDEGNVVEEVGAFNVADLRFGTSQYCHH